MTTKKGGLRDPRFLTPWARNCADERGKRWKTVHMKEKGEEVGEGATYRMRGQCNTSGRQRERVQGPCGRRAWAWVCWHNNTLVSHTCFIEVYTVITTVVLTKEGDIPHIGIRPEELVTVTGGRTVATIGSYFMPTKWALHTTVYRFSNWVKALIKTTFANLRAINNSVSDLLVPTDAM